MEGADLLAGIPPGLLQSMGAGGIVMLTILGILRGWIVPSRSVEKLQRVQDQRLAEEKARGDEWRAAAQAAGDRNDELTKQIASLQEVGRITLGMIEGMKAAVEKRGRETR